MSGEQASVGLRTERVWRAAGLGDLPAVGEDAPYRDERLRLRFQTAVFRGWTAWELHELPAAIAAFHAALDHGVGDPELLRWLVTHLIERRDDYLQKPQNGAWLPRSLRSEGNQPGTLVELELPQRSGESETNYDDKTTAALDLWHRLLLREPVELRRAAPVYFAYHPWIEPATRMVLAPVVAGNFLMGSPETEHERRTEEGPQHRVTLSDDFWMGIYPVTQEQYQIVMGEHRSKFRGQHRPVESVSWEDAVAFCKQLTEYASATGLVPEGYVFRLPTEAEWEYCCRAGTKTATAFGDRLSSQQANFNGNFPYGDAEKGPDLGKTSDVGSYPPNPWGLYDMHGNVWEWCLDSADWDDGVKTDTYVDDALDPLCQVGRLRVHRGGGWRRGGRLCRSAFRGADDPGNRRDNLGFRVCLARSPAEGQSGTET